MTIELISDYKVRNPGRVSFRWTTDEGDITYTLHLKAKPGGSYYNPYTQSISITSSTADVDGTTWSYSLSVDETNKMYNAEVVYEWWVSGTSTSGRAVFIWRPTIPDDACWVSDIPLVVYDPDIWISGTCEDIISKVYVNGKEAERSNGVWRCLVDLEPGKNTITVKIQDSWGVERVVANKVVELYEKETIIQNNWTMIDERAAYTGIYRDSGEELWPLERARKQVQQFRVNSTLPGVKSGLSAELRKYLTTTFGIGIKNNSCSSFMLASDPLYVYYSTDRMITVQEGRTDECGLIRLGYYPVPGYVRIYIDEKEVLQFDLDDYIIETDQPLKHYKVSYRYAELVSKEQTISEFVKDFLDGGVLDIWYLAWVNRNAQATGIEIFSWEERNWLAYSPVEVYKMGEWETCRLFGAEHPISMEFDPNNLKATDTFSWCGTKIEGLADQARNEGWFGWKNVVLDVSYWNNSDMVSCALLPWLYDAIYRRYDGYIPPVGEYKNLTDFTGIIWFTGGVCREDDLEVEL